MTGLRIGTNLAALAAARLLDVSENRVARAVERLASGLRVNRAADDPAGLALSERLRVRTLGFERAQKNVLDGLSVLQVVDGALSSVTEMLQRMRAILLQAASDTVSDADRHGALYEEAQALGLEIDRISRDTVFSGRHVFGERVPMTQSRTETHFPTEPQPETSTASRGTRETFVRGFREPFRPGTTEIIPPGALGGATETFAAGVTDFLPFDLRPATTTDAFPAHGVTDAFPARGVTEPTVTSGALETFARGVTETFTRGEKSPVHIVNDPLVDNVVTLAAAPEDYNPGLNGSEIVTVNETFQLSQDAGDYTVAGNVITINPSVLNAGDSVVVRYVKSGDNTFTLASAIEDYGGAGSEIVRLEGVQLTKGVDYTVAGNQVTLIGNSRLVGNNNDKNWNLEIEYVAAGGNDFTVAGADIADYAPDAGSEIVRLTGITLGGYRNNVLLAQGVDYTISGRTVTLIGAARLLGNNGAAPGVQSASLSIEYDQSAENTRALSGVANPDTVEVKIDGVTLTQGVDYILQAGNTEVQLIGAGRLVGRQTVEISYLEPGDEVYPLSDTPLDLNADPALADTEEVFVGGVLKTAGVDYVFTAPNEITFLPGGITGNPPVTISYLTAAESNVFPLSGVPVDYAPDAGSESVVVTTGGVPTIMTRGVDYFFSAPNEITFFAGRLRGEHDVEIGYVTGAAANDYTLPDTPADYDAAPNLAGSEIVTKILPDLTSVVLNAGVEYEFIAADQIRLIGAGRLRGGEDLRVAYVTDPNLTLNLGAVPDAGSTRVTVNWPPPDPPQDLTEGVDWDFVPGPGPSNQIRIRDGVIVGDPDSIQVAYQTGGGTVDFANAPLDYDADPALAGSERVYLDGVEQTPGVDYTFIDADTIQFAPGALQGNPEIRLEYPFDPAANTLDLAQAPDVYVPPPTGSEVVDVTAGQVVGPPPVSGVLTRGVHYNVVGDRIELVGPGRVKGDPTIRVGYVPTGSNTFALAGTPLDYLPGMAGSEVVTVDGGAPLDRTAGDYSMAGNQVTLQGARRLVSGPHTVVVQYVTSNEVTLDPVSMGVPGWIIDGSVSLTVDGNPVAQDPVNGWSVSTTPAGSTTDYMNPDTGTNFRVAKDLFNYTFRLNGTSRLVGDNGGAGHTVRIDFTFNPHEEFLLNMPVNTTIVNETVRNIFTGPVPESTVDGYEIASVFVPAQRYILEPGFRNFLLFNEFAAPFVRSATQIDYEYFDEEALVPVSWIIQAGPDKGDEVHLDIEAWSWETLGINDVNLTSRETAAESLALVDSALAQVNEWRALYGAKAARLANALQFDGVSQESQAAADSRLRDLDYADEIVAFTRAQILRQTGAAALAQANLVPSAVLALLG